MTAVSAMWVIVAMGFMMHTAYDYLRSLNDEDDE